MNALEKANMELDLDYERMREQAERDLIREVPPEMWDAFQKKRRELGAALSRFPERRQELRDVIAQETLDAYHAGVSPLVLAHLTEVCKGDYVPPY